MKTSPRLTACTFALSAALSCAAGSALAQQTDIAGGPVTSIKIVRQQTAEQTSSQTEVASPAQTTIKVKADTLVSVRFSGQTACSRTGGTGACHVRIVATPSDGGDDIELRPGPEFFDSADVPDGIGYPEAHSIDRSVVLDKAGKYRIELRYRVNNPDMVFELASWSMTIETAELRK